jgi:type IV pilus assembly protein PilW
MHTIDPKRLARPAQRGFTLIEILIALLVGLFLMGALLTIVQTNRRVFGEQNQLAQLQDNERIAMTMMTDVIQSAGYFPQPQTQPLINTLSGTLTAIPPFAQSQSIFGNYSLAAPGDSIQVRYMTAPGDGILNCSGVPNTGGANQLYVNIFQVLNGQLVCFLNGTMYVLVGGAPGSGLDIQNMSILYGVNTSLPMVGNNVDTYMNAQEVNATPALWNNIISVMVVLTFTNPLAAANPSQPATVTFQRVIGVMNQTGPMT